MALDFRTVVIRDAAILTGSYVVAAVDETVAGTTRNIDLSGVNQAVVYVDFTIGSLTSLELKMEFSPDGTNWYQETFQSISTGTATETLGVHTMIATGAYKIFVQTKDRYMRVSAKGTGTVTASSATLKLVYGKV